MNSLRIYLFFFLFVSGILLPEAKGEVSAGKIDSLISQLSGMEDGEKKIQLLNELALLFRESDPDKALIYSRQALSLATQLQSISSCAVTNKMMGEIFEIKHNYQPSINYYLISIKHYKTLDDKNELALLYNKLGHIYITNHYDYDQGMVYFNQALENAKHVGNSKEMATSYNSIGGIYYYQNDLDKANIYFRDALKIREEIGDESGIAASLNNIGEIHRLKGDFNKALDFYNQAIKINETIRHKHYLSINYLNMGLIYSSKGDTGKAKNYFLKSIDLNLQNRDTASIISNMIELGKHYNKQLDFDASLETFHEALELAIKYNDLNGQKDASYGLSIAYDGKGDTRKAFEKFKQYNALHDSLFAKTKADQLDELHSRFALNLKEKEIELKDNEIALLQREQKIFHFRQLLLFLSLFLVIIITILVYSNLQSKHKKNKLLMEQEAALSKAKHELMEIELKNKTHDLTNVALHLVEKNKFLHELKSELKLLRNAPVEQREERIKELAINVQQNINLQKDLDDFQSHINEVNTAFYRKLKTRFPGLTKNEEHLCAMLRLNLSSKEIAALNNISLRAVEMGRYRLRKKFDIPTTYSISDFLQEL